MYNMYDKPWMGESMVLRTFEFQGFKVNPSTRYVFSSLHRSVIFTLNVPHYDIKCYSKFEPLTPIGSFIIEDGI